MKSMQIKILNKSSNPIPSYETKFSAGVDLRANITEDVLLKPFKRCLVKTGIFLEIPEGYEAQVRPRSGLALKKGISLVNSPGTIDADYRGEIGVILINMSQEDFTVSHGDRIAQLVFAKCEQADWVEVEELNKTERGEGGFGSTGEK